MKNLPLYLPVLMIATTLLTLYFFYRASGNRKSILIISILWLTIQAAIGLTGFYLMENTLPPRFSLLIVLPLVAIGACFFTKRGRSFLDGFDSNWLTLLHVVRIPVEIVLFGLFIKSYVPELMTFEGRNFDILSGITAPIVFYFGFIKKKLNRNFFLAWNFVCLALLLNIVVHAILSAPVPFQQFAFDQPNIGVLYSPYVWLPCFIVPVVLFSHLAVIRHLLMQKQNIASVVKSLTALVAS
ncbi:MAG: hypothetical protein EOO10_11240 [Chitinophagaceae bacterium]|nr:MAG: hypothetical protein EOO10_11240 [Chitinophagaceae bacterium]